MDYISNPDLSKGIGRRRRDGNGRPKLGYWWFEAREGNTEATNELLNEMAKKYCYQHKLIKALTGIIVMFAPLFAILEIYDVMGLISLIVKAVKF